MQIILRDMSEITNFGKAFLATVDAGILGGSHKLLETDFPGKPT